MCMSTFRHCCWLCIHKSHCCLDPGWTSTQVSASGPVRASGWIHRYGTSGSQWDVAGWSVGWCISAWLSDSTESAHPERLGPVWEHLQRQRPEPRHESYSSGAEKYSVRHIILFCHWVWYNSTNYFTSLLSYCSNCKDALINHVLVKVNYVSHIMQIPPKKHQIDFSGGFQQFSHGRMI